MKAKSEKVLDRNMITGNPGKALVFFALPLILGNLFQQLYNIIDSIIVGNFVGSNALVAVGASAAITFLFVALATGMSIGSSVVISQFYGAKKYREMKIAITTIIITMFCLSLILMIIGLLLNKSILRFMNTPEVIMEDAAVYLGIYFMGLTFLFMYNTFTAVFNALGDSKKPLYFLFLSSIINVVLDLWFVISFNMGVAGVAWATLIAQGISAVISFVVLWRKLSKMELPKEIPAFSFHMLKQIFRVAIPSTIQQSIVSLGMVFVQTLVNGFGETVVAGYTAATKIDSITIMPMIAVGNAMSTFTAQNMGAGKSERIKKGYKTAFLMILAVSLTLTTVLFLMGDILVGAFVDTKTSQAVIDAGVDYLRVVSLFYILMGCMNITSGILRGAGDVRFYMACTMCNFATRVILAYALVGIFKQRAIWYAIPMGWLAGLVVARVRYRSGKWKEKRLI